MSIFPKVIFVTFGVFKFLFGVIVITFGETILTYYIGCQSPVPSMASDFFYIVRISLLSSFLHIRIPIIVKIMVNNKAASA